MNDKTNQNIATKKIPLLEVKWWKKLSNIKQALKTQEEVTELLNAIVDNDRTEVKDAIGDIVVTVIIQAHMHGFSLQDCLQSAYDVISKRKGKMVNGQFVKDE